MMAMIMSAQNHDSALVPDHIYLGAIELRKHAGLQNLIWGPY